jgi:DNA-binding winged helix-turn-helix (wHTH) protein
MRAPVYHFPPFQLDVRERRLTCDGRPIPLRGKVFDTLCLLLARAGHLVSREELMKAIWPDATVDENNLEHNLSVLRKVFRQNHPDTKLIETVSRRGYRFLADVQLAEYRPELFRLLHRGEAEGHSPSSRPRLQSSRGARRGGEPRGQAVRPLVVEDDELRRLARDLQIDVGSLLAKLVRNVDQMAADQSGDKVAELLSESTTIADEIARQLRAHLLPVGYLTDQSTMHGFLTEPEAELRTLEALSSQDEPRPANLNLTFLRKAGAV